MASTSSSSSSSSSDSSDSSSDVEEELKKLNVRDEKEINILLLGETGVGKSTFINAMANYLSIKYFGDAEKQGLVKLIPSVYRMRDKYKNDHEIKIGPKKDENESLKVGESATQNVKTYVFPISSGHAKVRLIDTPGMGDTRGIEQDERNCEYIVNYIRKIGKIHAICFLCKPANARKTIYFEYCVFQILSHLEKTVANNIFFLFTNTRGADYGPGESQLILERIVEDIKKHSGVKIPLEKDKNIFCFDNEGFRFLGAQEKNVEFDYSTRKKYIESWKHSAVQCWRFIKCLQRDTEPYVPSKLLEVNFARNTLFQFSKILAEITKLINDNECVLDRMNDNKRKELEAILELKNQKTAVTDVVITRMCQPMLVCTAVPSCAEVYKVNGIDKWHYKKICHSCYELSDDITKFVAGCPDIINCHSINKSTRRCNQCGCDFLVHMHVDYITSLEEQLRVDEDVSHRLAMRESLLDDCKEIVEDIKVKNIQFQSEYDTIKKFCMNLSRYLKGHAIIAFSDSYKEYIVYLINQKQAAGSSAVKSSINKLQKLRLEYIEAEEAYNQALNTPLTFKEDMNFEMKDEQFQNLFTLKQNGKKLHDIYHLQKIFASRDCQIKEYVHDKFYVTQKRENRGNKNDNSDSKGKRKGSRRGFRSRKNHQDGGNVDNPERPDSRCSTSSYKSNPPTRRNNPGHPPNRPDSRQSAPGYRYEPGDTNVPNPYPHGYPSNYSAPINYPRERSYPDRPSYNVQVTVNEESHRPRPKTTNQGSNPHYPPQGYGQHAPPPPPHGQHAPPPYGQYPPPYNQRPQPGYDQHAPHLHGRHPPPAYDRQYPPQGPPNRPPVGYPEEAYGYHSPNPPYNQPGYHQSGGQSRDAPPRGNTHQNASRGRYNNKPGGDRRNDGNSRGRSATRGGKDFNNDRSHSRGRRTDKSEVLDKKDQKNIEETSVKPHFTEIRKASSTQNLSVGPQTRRRMRRGRNAVRVLDKKDQKNIEDNSVKPHFTEIRKASSTQNLSVGRGMRRGRSAVRDIPDLMSINVPPPGKEGHRRSKENRSNTQTRYFRRRRSSSRN